MKLERSETFSGDGRTAWRVTFGKVRKWQYLWEDVFAPIWGPYCYSRRDAVWQWFKCWVGWVWRHSLCTWRALTMTTLLVATVTWVIALVTRERAHVLTAVVLQLIGCVFMVIHTHRRIR